MVKDGNFGTAEAVTWTVGDVVTGTPRCFAVYLYLNGEHANCKNGSINLAANYGLDIAFTKQAA